MQYLVHPVLYKSTNIPGTEATKGRYYAIVALQSGMVAGLQSGGNYLEQQEWSASTRQMFRFNRIFGGWVEIEVVDSGKVLAIESPNAGNRARIIEEARNGQKYQHFALSQEKNGLFKIISRASQLVVDLHDYAQGEGGLIQQYASHGGDNQKWILTEVLLDRAYEDLAATIYEHAGYTGRSQTLGIGSYDLDQLTLANDTISSVRVPAGLKVTLFEHHRFTGTNLMLFVDHDDLSKIRYNDRASSVVVEKVVTLFAGVGYTGKQMIVGVGGYVAADIEKAQIGNDRIKSIKVPSGMLVVAFEHTDFKGDYIILLEDAPSLPSAWVDRISSVIVKQTGIVVPAHSLRYGGKLTLHTLGRLLQATDDGKLVSTNMVGDPGQTFQIVRSGPTTLRSHVCYGDIVSLKSNRGKYVVAEADGSANANRDAIGEWEKFRIMRAGDTASHSFVAVGDIIALESIAHHRYLGTTDGGTRASSTSIGDNEKIRIATYVPPNQDGDGAGVAARTTRTTGGASACGANVCTTEACSADACGAAECSVASQVASVCGAAESGIAACVADVAMVAVGGISACVAAATGIGVCGADVCGGAVCVAAACGAAACGAAACGADACGAAAGGATYCQVNAGALSGCGAEACLANACGVNMCAADACAADACAVDVVPVVPFI